ncbi:MAG: hypothetical protein ABJE10_01135 [bacterium]
MRRIALPLVASMLVLSTVSCSDSSTKPPAFMAPAGQRYQLTQTGSLDTEIIALIQALFAPELQTAVLGRWNHIKSEVAAGNLPGAKTSLLEAIEFIKSKQSEMNPPPNHESIPTATARLVLYMALYVYDGPNTPVPLQLGIGTDAAAEIVKPTAPTLIQTPLRHASSNFDAGSVTTNTIVVVAQNTTFFQSHCSGPLTTKYCQYPIFYEYHSFPHVRFEKPVRIAMCPVPPGGNYGVLPGIDDDMLVRAHDKPANPADFTPGGFPIPGEAVEILPLNTAFDPTHPTIICAGTAYPQVALFHVPQHPVGVLANALAFGARTANGAARLVAKAVTPKDAYAIDNGVEHFALEFSKFANMDTTGRPDLQALHVMLSLRTVSRGGTLNVTWTLANAGAAPSPGVATVLRLTPTGNTPGGPIDLVATTPPSVAGIFPLDSRTQTVSVKITEGVASGTYTLGPIVSTTGGLPEKSSTLGDNRQARELTVR